MQTCGLAFAEGRISGSAGVNSYFATYEVDGETLTLGPVGSTMMMGPEKAMAQELAFLSALATAKSYQVDGDTLEINFEGGSLLFAASK
jgi:heat shock protein HslJ